MIMEADANGKSAKSVAFLLQRVGPYHHARLRALAADPSLSVCAIEFRTADPVYPWDPVDDTAGYVRHKASGPRQLCRALEDAAPDVVVAAGYSDTEIHRAAAWALRTGVPLVVCSDSNYDDEPRTWAKEALKRLTLAAFEAALVAGSRAHEYMGMLGLNGNRRFRPWDVVDNAHFQRGAEAARRAPRETRTRLGLPENYFICAARFVPKKNLGRLVEAYTLYVSAAGESAWSLVLSGSGPLEAELRARVAAEGMASRVHFPGFLQYEDLPACYGLAGALVLPSESDQWGLVVNEAMAAGLPVVVSSRCGCAPDLVRVGENGFIFEPDQTAVLADLLGRIAGMSAERRLAMGARSREIVAAFTPEAFASGLKSAIGCALSQRRRRSGIITRAVVGALASRPPR
jgi:1,2-diacylglycerol 3-alpha-glucosyltransferase